MNPSPEPTRSRLAQAEAELAARAREMAALQDQLARLEGQLSRVQGQMESLRAPTASGGEVRAVLQALLSEMESSRRSPPAKETLLAGEGKVFATTLHHLRQLQNAELEGDFLMTVDEVACAVTDPAWRAAWRRGEQPPVFYGASVSERGGPGEWFQRIARDFCQWLFDPQGVGDAAGFGENELWAAMLELFAEDRIERLVARNDFDGANYLSRRLRAFCARLAEIKRRSPGFTSWAELLGFGRREISRAVFPMQDCRLVIRGALPGLRLGHGSGVEVSTWRTEPAMPGEGLERVALEALIFRTAYPGEPFRAVVETYSPELTIREVDRLTLNRVLRTRVVPVFFELAQLPRPEALDDPELDFFALRQREEVGLE